MSFVFAIYYLGTREAVLQNSLIYCNLRFYPYLETSKDNGL